MQTQTSNDLHNAIMEAGGKDRPPMLAPGIDNDIYSTVDACPNACEMWKAIERLKQDESINVQDLETNLYWEFGKFTSRDGESLESYYSSKGMSETAMSKGCSLSQGMKSKLTRGMTLMMNLKIRNWKHIRCTWHKFKSEHPEQSKCVNDTYLIEQDEHNVIIDSLDMSYDREQVDQDDDDDLANERDLLASLI
nr:hypothetical protein [Tanacetum cinerariifolium]